MVLAARLRRTPIVLLEQNTIPGVASRTLGRVASRVCLGFAEAARYFPSGRSVHTGNPVRAASSRRRPARTDPGLLVFGGSQGARRLNDALLDAAGRLGPRIGALRIRHQTGVPDHDRMVAGWASLGIAARVDAFVTDMGGAYAEATSSSPGRAP
jgi:UDP-N-acetylglucosamine--N-acetylmuramyl-(pentapeptide) pyrophosphoryl-undecaprenol N-acetylglucosamine transferase